MPIANIKLNGEKLKAISLKLETRSLSYVFSLSVQHSRARQLKLGTEENQGDTN